MARAAGARIALDSSGEGLRAARLAGVDLIKPNREELAELAQVAVHEVSTVEGALAAARSLVGACARTVLATLGSEGAILVEAEGALLARVEPEAFVSSVGAGDASLAAYLRADSRGEGPAERLRAAVAGGAASLAEPVAGALDRERFDRLVRAARTEALAP